MRQTSPIERLAWMEQCKDIIVNMYGVDGNAFCIIAAVTKEMRRAGAPQDVIASFFKEATSGDYENLLKTCQSWVTLVDIKPSNGTTAIAAFNGAKIRIPADD